MLPSIAQLVERRTVVYNGIVILRSLVRFRLEGRVGILRVATTQRASRCFPVSYVVFPLLESFSPDLTPSQR